MTVCCDITDGGCDGLLDTGTDGGSSNAGTTGGGIDAGSRDGGPLTSTDPRTFRITCGCGSTGPDFGTLIAALWLYTHFRRRLQRRAFAYPY